MKKIFLLLNVFVWHFCFAQAPVIKSTHPRVDVQQERFEWLKQNIDSGECKTTFEKFKWYYYEEWLPSEDFYMLGDDINNWNCNWESPEAREMAKLTAFLVQIDYDTLSVTRCNFIASKYIDFLNHINFDDYEDHDTHENIFRFNCNEGSLFFDWAYNCLESEIRQGLAKALYRFLETFLYDYIIDIEGGSSYVCSHNIFNCVVAMRTCLALHDAEGFSIEEKHNIDEWYEILFDKWDTGILPAQAYFRGKNGGWNWGAGYGYMAFHQQYQFFDDMLAATGKNYYEEQAYWIKESINQYWYYFRPSSYTIHFGDAMLYIEAADRVMYRHADVYKDVRSQYLAQKYADMAYICNSTVSVDKLLQYDFLASPVEHPEMPLNWFGEEVGLSVSRTSWDPDATMVWFLSPEKRRADHEHRDNNTFVIIKDKPLILHSGTYRLFHTAHYRNYYSRTIAHNSICVFDSEEQFGIFGDPAANDGGQIESERIENLESVDLPEHQRAKWLQYAATDDYVYHVADAGKAYNQNKLDRFERRFLYLKPDKVIVLDHLHINNVTTEERQVKYINHFVNRPDISGDIINTDVPNHIITYNGQDYTTTNGNGSVGIRTLLPRDSKTTLIGGDGYAFWVDGVNYQPDSYEEGEYHPGAWRIEVESENVMENPIFLHVINISDGSSPAAPQGELIQNDTTIGVDGGDAIYLFSAIGKMNNERYIVNTLKGNRSIDIMAFDTKAEVYYDLLVNGVLKQSVMASDKGVIEFDTENLTLEDNTIEITESHVSPDVNNDNITIYPNPTQGHFKVVIHNSNVKNFTVEIYDASGKNVANYKNVSNYQILSFVADKGVYLLHLSYDNKTYAYKLVMQ